MISYIVALAYLATLGPPSTSIAVCWALAAIEVALVVLLLNLIVFHIYIGVKGISTYTYLSNKRDE